MLKTQVDRVLVVVIALLAAGLLFTLKGVFQERLVQAGDSAPGFSITADNGRKFSKDDFEGRLLVLNFWATWCPPCIEEMPSLNEFARTMKNQGVTVLGVSVDKNEQAYKRFLQQAQLAFPTARDPNADISTEYGTFKWPETYVINRDGKVILKYIGPRDWMSQQVISEIKSFL